METFFTPPRIILIALVVFCPLSLQAHEPGLSSVQIEMKSEKIAISLSFAVRDLEILKNTESESAGRPEITAEDGWFRSLLLKSTVLQINDEDIQGVIRSVSADRRDGLCVEFDFPVREQGLIRFYSKLIDQLALGHRQIITLKRDGEISGIGLLSAQNPEFVFNREFPSLWPEFHSFIREGVRHIWIGSDHILFLLSLLLPAALVRQRNQWLPRDELRSISLEIFRIVTAFTLAHSITLALAVLGIVRVPAAVVESLIAVSVILAAGNNILPLVCNRLWLLTFGFGLIHGMGFARVLTDLGLPGQGRGFALFAFNIGVEIGQLAILAVFLPLIFALRRADCYRHIGMQAASWVIIAISLNWMIERVSQISLTGLTS